MKFVGRLGIDDDGLGTCYGDVSQCKLSQKG